MPDLRRQVLESGKTISRKAASREGSRRTSRANSAQNSRQSSRNASRQGSDDEDAGNLSDDTAASLGSFDDLDIDDAGSEDADLEEATIDWASELPQIIEDILERKRTSGPGREEKYTAFNRILKAHYVEETLRRQVSDLTAAFARSIKNETTVHETTLALRALELLTITAGDYTIFKKVEPLLTRTIRGSTSTAVKAGAISCLTTCTMFGGASDDDIQDQMTFLLDVAASDGQSIEAQDNPTACITAALQGWGLMATEIDDLEGESEEAVQIFMDQLNGGDPSTQIAAGENIALLYEKSYTLQENYNDKGMEDDSDHEDGSGSDSDNEFGSYPKLVKRYNAYHNTPELERQLQALATLHNKRISKRDKKSLHKNFASIRNTVSNPRRGPMYNTATDTTRSYGSRLTFKVGQQGAVHIDRWWKWIRVNAFRRTLQGGFPSHYFEGNNAILESLPVVMVRMPRTNDRGWSPRRETKMRMNQRRAKMEAPDDSY
ncbi:IFRD domain protein [Aspergillus unguis]